MQAITLIVSVHFDLCAQVRFSVPNHPSCTQQMRSISFLPLAPKLRSLGCVHSRPGFNLPFSPPSLRPSLTGVLCRICPLKDLPEFMEEHLREWMEGFVKCLEYVNPALAAGEEDSHPSHISVLQAGVVDNLALFMSKYEEEFEPYLGTLLGHVWDLLVGTSLAPHHDLLVATAIRFLTTVASSVHHKLFAQPEVLQNVCRKIIVPNVQLLQSDEELFEDNPFEFVRRDIEGSDADTRRRVSCDLVRGLCRNYEKEVTELFSADIEALLGLYSSNIAVNWKSKDVAVYLVIALTLKGGSSKLGATQINQSFNIMDFYRQHVLPDLQKAAAGGLPSPHYIITADAIKFVSVFRMQLDAATYGQLVPLLVQMLASKHILVHTYAANAIERLLTVKDLDTNERRFGAAQLAPILDQLLTKLFALLNMFGIDENQYVMRTIMRVTVVAGEAMAPYASFCIESLKSVLQRVCANPSNPTFNHYLFESVASLVQFICAATPTAVDAFEALLFPPFQQVLQLDISEFTPYVFQVLAQLLEYRPAISVAYEGLFAPLLMPAMWERPGNIPALVRLLFAYMSKGKALVFAKLESVLGVFQKLLATRATDAFAFQLLSAIWRCFDLNEMQQYLNPIFNLMLQRLQSNKKAGPSATGCCAVFVARFGAPALRAQLEAIQPNLAAMMLRDVWAEHAPNVSGAVARKTVVISTTRVLQVPEVLISTPDTFLALLQAAVAVILADHGVNSGANDELEEQDNFEEVGGSGLGYTTAYVQLNFASSAEKDFYSSEDSIAALCTTMAQLSASQPGLAQLLRTLPMSKQQELHGLLQQPGFLRANFPRGA